MIWHFLNTGHLDGAENMRIDAELVGRLQAGTDGCTLRVYGWSPWTISLGWNQAMEDIDVEKAARSGVGVVRRPTGGRAVLHANELTYSIAMVSDTKSVVQAYAEVSRALVAGLRLLGVRAVLERSQPRFAEVYKDPSSAACFVSTGRYEIKVDGKKIVGSAQRRYVRADGREAVLQHGSILLGREHRRLGEFLRLDETRRRFFRNELEVRTTDLLTVLQRSVSFEEAADAIRAGFEQAWRIRFQEPHSHGVA